MPLDTAYTPLESLLLFQALRAEGSVSSIGFNRISDQLKAVPLIRDAATYEAGRLSPDALRDLYLQLVKEEAKHELSSSHDQDAAGLTTNGSVSPASRKRKAPSPPLPTFSDAAQHAHLIPKLVSRLYARYREVAVRDIRETEKKFSALSTAGTQGIPEPNAAQPKQTVSESQSARATQAAQIQPAPSRNGHSPEQNSVEPGPSTPAVVDSKAQALPKRTIKGKIDAVLNPSGETQNGSSDHRRTSSGTTLPPLSEIAPQSPAALPSKLQPNTVQLGYRQSPTAGHAPPFPPHVPLAPHGSPHLQHSSSRPSSSPRPVLPPQLGAKPPPQSPNQQTGSPHTHHPPIQPHPQQLYQPQHPHPAYYQQPPVYPERRAPYPIQPAQAPGQYPPHTPQQGGYQLQPFYINGSGQPVPAHPHIARGQPPLYPQHYAGYPPYQQNAPASMPRQIGRPGLLKISAALATPTRPLWKSERRPRPAVVPPAVQRPHPEPLSPTLGRAKSPEKSTRSGRTRDVNAKAAATPSETIGRSRRRRDRSPHSVVSTAGSGRTRSQSVSTAVGDARNNIKPEPSVADDSEMHTDPPATPTAGPRTRKRRGTMQSQAQPQAKRKRRSSHTATAEDDTELGSPPPRSNLIRATRNFNKISDTVMTGINSHKHASWFVNPVKTAGYSEIIKRPQDLKSIKAAIVAGGKAVTALTVPGDSAAEPPANQFTAADGTTFFEVARAIDLIPPKGIVNAAQLEKEVFRVLANAVMFNPGDDGLVGESREMAEDAERTINEWRGTEREHEEEEDPKGKRRKV